MRAWGTHPGVVSHGTLPVHDGLSGRDGLLPGGPALEVHRQDVHGTAAQGQGLHPVNVGLGDAEAGRVDCKVDALCTVVVPEQNGSGVHGLPPISPQRPGAGPPEWTRPPGP